MELDFYLQQIDKYRVKVIDNSTLIEINPIESVYQMSLSIVSSKIPLGGVYNIDVLPYVITNKKAKEIYEITSSTLGFPVDTVIPDGVYTLTWVVNDTIYKTHKFCNYSTIKEQVELLVNETGYNVEVGNYDITFVGDTGNSDVLKVRLAVTLLDYLREVAAKGNETECNNTLDKLNRLLMIIQQ